MRLSSRILVSAIWLCCMSTAAEAQSCLLGAGVPFPRDSGNIRLKLSITHVSSDPVGVDTVPIRLDTADGYCRLHVSPASEAGAFRITFKVDNVGGAQAPDHLTVQLRPTNVAELDVRMEPTAVTLGTPQTANIAIIPRHARAAQEYGVAVSIAADTGGTGTFPIGLLWTPPPAFQLVTATADCGADLCIGAGPTQNVVLKGADTSQVDIMRSVTIEAGKADGSFGPKTSARIDVGRGGLQFALSPVGDATQYRISIPLRVARLSDSKQGAGTLANTWTTTPSARAATLMAADARILYASSSAKEEEVLLLRTGAAPTPVKIPRPSAASDQAAFDELHSKTPGAFQVRDRALAATASAVAQFQLERTTADTIYGSLSPLAPTVKRTPRQGLPVLAIDRDGSEIALRARFAVSPALHVERTVMELANHEEPGATAHPGQTLLMRLEGPGVHYFTQASMHGAVVELLPKSGVSDSTWVKLQVSRAARQMEKLVLANPDGEAQEVAVLVTPNRRPSPTMRFVKLRMQGDEYDMEQLRARKTPFTRRQLGGVVIKFDNEAIDTDNALYGVQYLRVDVSLKDARGTDQGKVEKCFAIVPPDVNGVRYPVDGSCTATEGTVSLSDLVDRSYRATAGSTMTIGLKQDPSLYPDESPRGRQEIVVQRGGRLIVEPVLSLPAGLISLKNGKFSPGLTYTGALVNLQPARWHVRSAEQVGFQFGIAYTTPPNSGPQASPISGQFVTVGGLMYSFRNMAGDVSLDLFGGAMLPVTGRGWRLRDRYYVFRPGFTVPLSPKS